VIALVLTWSPSDIRPRILIYLPSPRDLTFEVSAGLCEINRLFFRSGHVWSPSTIRIFVGTPFENSLFSFLPVFPLRGNYRLCEMKDSL